MKNAKWKKYVPWALLTEAVGGLSGWLTRAGTRHYETTALQPPLSPPAIVFPVVWVLLFALMGVGAARVSAADRSSRRSASLGIFFLQLAVNFFWSILFFNFRLYGLAFVWLLLLWGLILWMIRAFYGVDRTAAWLQVPYLLWVTFAAYLNLGVWLLNR